MATRDPVADLRQIAFLLERANEATYRVRAFRSAAATLEELGAAEVAQRAAAGTLGKTKGIGEVTARLPEMMPGQVLSRPEVKGIETIGESALIIRIETKVAPGIHYDVKRVLHRLLVDGFNANGLEIPYPKAVELSPEEKPAAASS